MNMRGIGEPVPEDKILVVAETYSAAESLMAIGHDERDEAVAIFQQRGEPIREFARRATARIRRLENERFRPRRAILALESGCSESALKARTFIARALLAALCAAGGSELVLAGNQHFTDSARHELLGLVEALTFSLAGHPIGIRIQFTADPPARAPSFASDVPPVIRATQRSRQALAAAEGW